MTKREKEIIGRARDVFKESRKLLADAGAPLQLSFPAIVAADVLDWVLGEFPAFGDHVMLMARKNQELGNRRPAPHEEIQILPGWASPPALDKSARARQPPRGIDPRISADQRFLRACGIQADAQDK